MAIKRPSFEIRILIENTDYLDQESPFQNQIDSLRKLIERHIEEGLNLNTNLGYYNKGMFHLNDGDILFERFEIKRLLGHGGMGEVHQAYDKRLERTVAIKVIKLRSFKDPEKAKKKFLIEGKLTAKLNHANIVKVYDLLEDENNLYLVMEHLEGESLASLLKRGKVAKEKALKINQDISNALNYLHHFEGGVLHRDVSPHNIFIKTNGVAKLLDYGVSKVEDIDSEQTETYYYKLSYTCPELWLDGVYQGENYKAHHDFYSLALVTHEMLTGKRIFKEMEAIKGFPKEIESCGVEEIDQVILGIKYNLPQRKQALYNVDETITSASHDLKKAHAKTNHFKKLLFLFIPTAIFFTVFIFIRSNHDKEIILLHKDQEHYFKKEENPERFSFSMNTNACLSWCFTLQTYPNIYLDGKNLKIEEVSRFIDEKWSHYQALNESQCMTLTPYCEMTYRFSNEFKSYMDKNFQKATYKGFKEFAVKRLGNVFSIDDISNFLSSPHKYTDLGNLFYDYRDEFMIPYRGQILPQKKRSFFYLNQNTLGLKYHLFQDLDRIYEVNYDYCQEKGDMAYVSYLSHLFFQGKEFPKDSFNILAFGKSWFAEVAGKDKLLEMPVKFRWTLKDKPKEARLCRYERKGITKLKVDVLKMDN